MPIMNGFEAVKKMREFETEVSITKKSIIIGVSANSEEQMSFLAEESGMNAFLTKPFRINQLLEIYENEISLQSSNFQVQYSSN